MKAKELMLHNVYHSKKGYFLLMILFLGVTCIIETLCLVYVTKEVIRFILLGNGRKIEVLLMEALSFVVMVAVSKLMSSFFLFQIKKYVAINMENAAIKHLFNLSNWQVKYNQGECFAKVRTDIPNLASKYLDNISLSVSMFLNIILGSIYACYLDWRVFLLCLLLVIISYLITSKSYKRMPAIEKNAGNLYNRNYRNVWEYVSNSEIIPFLDFKRVTNDFEKTVKDNVENAVKKGKSYANVNISQKIINVGLVLVMCIVGAFCSLGVDDLPAYIAKLTALIVLVPKVATSLMACYDWNMCRMEIKGIYTRLDDFFILEEYKTRAKNSICTQKFDSLNLINVSVFYDEKQVLNKLSYCFVESNLYCVVGKSGSGKSTLLKAICGLLPIKKGMVYIGKTDLTCIDRESLWKKITYVSQQSKVFKGSIQKNIILDENYNEEKFIEAYKISTLDATISDFDRVNNEMVDETKLSSGEKQKICLARAIYLNKGVLILDEALSAMDPTSQKEVINNLYRYSIHNHLICIMVEHNEGIIPSNAVKLRLDGGILVC